jgi:ubiquinone/menaquinone biosynthesis C-methylase UbiE
MSEDKVMDWDGLYQEGTTPWQRRDLNPAFIHWRHTHLHKPCHILVPGCGTSPEVVELARMGFHVTALDLSPTAIEKQREMLKEARVSATLEVDDVLTWMPEHHFDLIYEQTCLCAITPHDRHFYHQQLRHWLKPEGSLLALFMQTGEAGGPPYDCPVPDMKVLFSDEHWHWPEPPYFQSPHSGEMFEYAVELKRHERPVV